MKKRKKKNIETSAYTPPTSPVKIPKGDTGFNLVKSAFNVSEDKAPETGAYEPPVSPVKIPKGDTGFNTVKKGYRRFIWTWKEYLGKKPKFYKS